MKLKLLVESLFLLPWAKKEAEGFCSQSGCTDGKYPGAGLVGDLYMSLIHTCQLCGANSFDYLSQLQRHAEELASQPAGWMPWNYRRTFAGLTPE